MMSYRSSVHFIPVQWFLAELWPLDFELWPNILLSLLFFTMLGDIDLMFGIWVYNDELQIKFTFHSGPMIFGRFMALGLWNLAKYLVVSTLFHYDLRYWLDFWYESVYWWVTDQLWNSFVILNLLLRELKKGETFASLLNIDGGDIRVVPTHLVFILTYSEFCVYFPNL
jgi:hypothetical protein